jgi:hypothetical protein
MSNVHGEKKRALGVVRDILVTVQGITIKANMEVIDTDAYAIIVENG